jgi:thioredoxin 1
MDMSMGLEQAEKPSNLTLDTGAGTSGAWRDVSAALWDKASLAGATGCAESKITDSAFSHNLPAPVFAGAGDKTAAISAGRVTDKSFDAEVLKAKGPVVVAFWAPWCGACKAAAPMIEALAKEYDGKAKVVKLNVDQNKKTGRAYDIKALPTMVVFQDGQVVEKITGGGPEAKRKLVKAIKHHLQDKTPRQ